MARPDFSQRAGLKEHPELMDGPCSYEELRDCLQDIARVNALTQAYRPTLAWLDGVVRSAGVLLDNPRSQTRELGNPPLRVVDVGCGYGDMLRRIEAWAKRRGVTVALLGIDLNPNAVRAAREATAAGSQIRYVAGDAYSCVETLEADVVISSLLTHHLEEHEIVRFLGWMESTARVGWFINDLHRQPVPYYAFRIMATVAGWHRFVRHDGPVSILRSFVPEDWQRMCAMAGLDMGAVEMVRYRPARLCVGRVKAGQ